MLLADMLLSLVCLLTCCSPSCSFLAQTSSPTAADVLKQQQAAAQKAAARKKATESKYDEGEDISTSTSHCVPNTIAACTLV